MIRMGGTPPARPDWTPAHPYREAVSVALLIELGYVPAVVSTTNTTNGALEVDDGELVLVIYDLDDQGRKQIEDGAPVWHEERVPISPERLERYHADIQAVTDTYEPR